MTALHGLLVNTHILFGAASLVLFWIPVVARKGSPLHVRAGRYYSIAMYVVSVSAFVASMLVLADPIGIRRPGLEIDSEAAAELAGIEDGSYFYFVHSFYALIRVLSSLELIS